jgi:hypothetical protein
VPEGLVDVLRLDHLSGHRPPPEIRPGRRFALMR